MSRPVLPIVILLGVFLLSIPATSALNVASRSAKARPSEAYSPHTAWEAGYYGCNTTIAFFDDGIDDGHPYLGDKIVAGTDTTATGPVWDELDDGNPKPITGAHGTPVAGMALSHAGKPFSRASDAPDFEPEDLTGAAPCAWGVDVMLSDVKSDDDFQTDFLQAFEWTLNHSEAPWGDEDPSNDGVDVITASYYANTESDGSDPVCQAAERAIEAGIVVLGSAGNSGEEQRPGLFNCPDAADRAISVANVWNNRTVDRSDDRLWRNSTWGPRNDDGDGDPYDELKPTIAAPGHRVVSTGAGPAGGHGYQLAGCHGVRDVPKNPPFIVQHFSPLCEQEFGGTSAASPFAAGVVALMLDANPELGPLEVKQILQQTADVHPEMGLSAPDVSGKWDHRYGYGMIDAWDAVNMARKWPGLDLGADTDADGIRDAIDQGPRDPRNVNLVQPDAIEPAGGSMDSDGDGVVDDRDPAPLDPHAPGGTATFGDAAGSIELHASDGRSPSPVEDPEPRGAGLSEVGLPGYAAVVSLAAAALAAVSRRWT